MFASSFFVSCFDLTPHFYFIVGPLFVLATENTRERIVTGKTGDPTPEEIQQSVLKMLASKTRGPKRRQDRVSHGQISFGDLARTIAGKWKAIDPKLKAIYNHFAAQEKVRYKKEVVIWKEKKEREHDAALAAKLTSSSGYSSSYNDSMMSMSSSATSMSTAMSTSYNLSESINSLQGGMGMQLHDADVVQRQQDILRQQLGFIGSKPQARMDGSDNASREAPKPELNGSGNNSGLQGMQFSSRIGGNGDPNGMNMNNHMCMSRNGSLLGSNLQMHRINHKEQLLMQLQQQQQQQLQHLQQAREETSRMSNMKTADTFVSCMQPSRMTSNDQRQFPSSSLAQQGTPNSTNPKQLMEQFRELENITQELDRLKKKELQMQQMIEEQQNKSNAAGLWPDNPSFGNSFTGTPQAVAISNLNSGTEFTSSLNDTLLSTFDMEDRQRAVRRSRSGGANLYRGWAADLNALNGSVAGDRTGLRRRHSAFGSDDVSIGNTGFRSAPSSLGGNHQQQHGQNQGRRDSLSALLQLDDVSGVGTSDQQHQLQLQQNSFAEMLQMQDNGGHNDLGSIFNSNPGGGT